MSTLEPFALPASPTIPLTDDARKAYETLYETMETAIESTSNAAVLEALNARIADVDDVLTQDSMYRLNANTIALAALQKQINETNKGLKELQSQIESIATHFGMAGDVLAAIGKVLSLIPGI
jgi:hypothetical protein